MTTATSQFTEQDIAFIRAVRELVNADPGYRYPSRDGQCYYIWNGCGDCLIGQALVQVGVSVEELATHDETAEKSAEGALTVLGSLGYSGEVCHWGDRLQGLQDNDSTWRDALTLSDIDYPSIAALA